MDVAPKTFNCVLSQIGPGWVAECIAADHQNPVADVLPRKMIHHQKDGRGRGVAEWSRQGLLISNFKFQISNIFKIQDSKFKIQNDV